MATKFTYQILPSQVFVSTTTSLTILVSNPLFGETVELRKGTAEDILLPDCLGTALAEAYEIDVFIPTPPDSTPAGSLTDEFDEISCSALDPGWGCLKVDSASGRYFKLFPLGDTQLAPGDSVRFELSNVIVNDVVGAPLVNVLEIIGSDSNSTNVPMSKLPQELAISSWVIPSTVGINERATLSWSAFGGSHVTVSPTPSGIPDSFPCSGGGVCAGSTQVKVFPDTQAQLTFTVKIVTDDNFSASTQVPLTVSQPVLVDFDAQVDGSSLTGAIDIDQRVTFVWDIKFVGSGQVFLTPAAGSGRVQPDGSKTLQPADFLPANDTQLAFRLRTENAFAHQISRTLTIDFNPARIVLFRFANPELTQIAPLVVENAQDQQMSFGSPNRLTVVGPGGPLEQDLGTPSTQPQVMYLAADPPAVKAGEKSTLHYITLNAESAVLMPDNIELPQEPLGDGKAEGTYDVEPGETTEYVVEVSDGSRLIRSPVTVVVE